MSQREPPRAQAILRGKFYIFQSDVIMAIFFSGSRTPPTPRLHCTYGFNLYSPSRPPAPGGPGHPECAGIQYPRPAAPGDGAASKLVGLTCYARMFVHPMMVMFTSLCRNTPSLVLRLPVFIAHATVAAAVAQWTIPYFHHPSPKKS